LKAIRFAIEDQTTAETIKQHLAKMAQERFPTGDA